MRRLLHDVAFAARARSANNSQTQSLAGSLDRDDGSVATAGDCLLVHATPAPAAAGLFHGHEHHFLGRATAAHILEDAAAAAAATRAAPAPAHLAIVEMEAAAGKAAEAAAPLAAVVGAGASAEEAALVVEAVACAGAGAVGGARPSPAEPEEQEPLCGGGAAVVDDDADLDAAAAKLQARIRGRQERGDAAVAPPPAPAEDPGALGRTSEVPAAAEEADEAPADDADPDAAVAKLQARMRGRQQRAEAPEETQVPMKSKHHTRAKYDDSEEEGIPHSPEPVARTRETLEPAPEPAPPAP